MNNLLILILIILIILIILTKKYINCDPKYYLIFIVAIVYYLYVSYFSKENFIFDSNQSILKLNEKITFFENNKLTIPE